MRKDKIELLKALKRIKSIWVHKGYKHLPVPDAGICSQVRRLIGYCGTDIPTPATRLLRRYFEVWPKCSKAIGYPIPYIRNKKLYTDEDFARSVFYSSDKHDMWNRHKSEYARLRWELLNFCIDTLEKELKE
jgi:hypothetical protein